MPLTDSACKASKPKDKPYKLTDSNGMFLLIHPNGSKYWRLKYRYLGKEKTLALGVYPEVSLSEARDKRIEARKLLAHNIDPSYSKKEAKRQSLIKAENTFEVIAREWHSNNSGNWTSRYSQYVLGRLEKDIFPFIGYRPIAELKPPELLDVFRKIERRGAQEIAHRTMQCTTQVFRYAIITGRAERNPAIDLKGALKPVKRGHYAALDVRELPEFVKCLNNNHARLYMHTRLAINLMMLTFVRTGELINAKWSEFDLDNSEWLIPAERMKMRNAHIVPLSRQALVILNELKKLTGKDDAMSIAKALIYPRVLSTSITTSFGQQTQKFVSTVLEGFGSAIPGIDIEFTDQIDGRKKYCQVKLGPKTINKDDIKTIDGHFSSIRNLAKTNSLKLEYNDLIIGVLYGEIFQLSFHYKYLQNKLHYPVYIGKDFWQRLTGSEGFYYELSNAISEIANEFDSTDLLEETINTLAQSDIIKKLVEK